MTSTLFPIRIAAFPGESLLGYLKRLAKVLEAGSVSSLIPDLVDPGALHALPTRELDWLERSLRDQWKVLAPSRMLAQGDDVVLHGTRMARDLVRFSRMWICPECVSESPYHRNAWYFAPLSACHHHGRELIDQCTKCDRKLEWNKSGLDHCGNCGTALTDMRGQEVDTPYRQAMKIIHEIALGTTPTELLCLHSLSGEDQIDLLLVLGRIATNVDGHKHHPGTLMRNSSRADLITRGVELAREWPTRLHVYLDRLAASNTDFPADNVRRLSPAHKYIEQQPDEGWRQVLNKAFREYLEERNYALPQSGRLKYATALLNDDKLTSR